MREAAALAFLLLAGCAVGPDFLRPEPPKDAAYTAEPVTATAPAAGEAQHFAAGQEIPAAWWPLFKSPRLNTLIEQALRASPNIEAAKAALAQAHELTLSGEAAFFPTLQGSAGASRNLTPNATLSPATATGNPYYSLYTTQLAVSYMPDVFGGTRRQVESSVAQAEFQRFQLEAAYLTLASDVVVSVVQEASLRAQIAATQDIIDIESQQLDVLQHQFELGGASRAAVLAQAATLAQTRATLPPLAKQLAQERNLIATLAGRFPNDPPAETFELSTLYLPQELPLSLPSRLVEQRPDIRSAEALLHSASAQVGVATANLLPQITLTGQYGTISTGNPLAGLPVWSIGAGLTQPLFRGGELLHARRAAVAAYEEAAAQYRSTVLTAFQNVADALRALQSDADALSAQVVAERAAADSLDIARRQFQLGAINYLLLLNAEQTYQQAHIALVQAQANRYADTAALFQALGGGWWNRRDVAAANQDGER